MNCSLRKNALAVLATLTLAAAPACMLGDKGYAGGDEDVGESGDAVKTRCADGSFRWHCPDAGSSLDASPTPAPTTTSTAPAPTTTSTATPPPPSGRWMPKPGTTWQWQLSGTGAIDTSFDVMAYDIDLFETAQSVIDGLHAKGRKVICYFDTAYEPGRPDSALLYPYRGNAVQGWPGQYWLKVQDPVVLGAMKKRIALAKSKACDAIEADDVDSFFNNPGTGITRQQQQDFIRALAAEAHAQGMSYALKNDLDDISVLLPDVDFALNEECFAYDECDTLKPFIAANKAVLQVEYTTKSNFATKGATICPKANALNFDTLIKQLDLDASRYACR